MTPGRAAVDLVFRDTALGVGGSSPWRTPDGTSPRRAPDTDDVADALTLPGDVVGWVPDISAVFDPGINRYTLAAQELIGAAWDGAARARIFDLVRREEPETVIALADMLPAGSRGPHYGRVV
ncbi:hypothetical protein [Pseudofrankia inefficax]|uniref:hypothetical protein n=1 Tax=Pseudofrankia inefficax (strain DSM 45817 / CECT 9037 / DDB 130130 / EuI1c) TaxID=298654 RepID=UPI0003267504|nr:hypothetical protein [Pseudofrankia inefficax]